MMTRIKVAAVFIIFLSVGVAIAEKPQPRIRPAAREVIARSCVGEAGFDAYEECQQIAWVYVKKARQLGLPLITVVRQYSQAVKPRPDHPRPWILGLTRGMRSPPEHWPDNLKWKRLHKVLWEHTLVAVDVWAEGQVPDLFPEATDYGGDMDTPAAEKKGCRVVRPARELYQVKMKNTFWRCPGAL